MFHFTEETKGDYDRLQLGRIALIEMNIIIFLCWYFSCLLWEPDTQEETHVVFTLW